MCLHDLNFAMARVGKMLVGVGFKVIESRMFNKDGSINKEEVGDSHWSKSWQSSSPESDLESIDGMKKFDETLLHIPSTFFGSDNGSYYIPGFHIFLRKEDAERYGDEDDVLVKVHFSDVLAFGTNRAGKKMGPCVVADKMKIVEIMNPEVIKKHYEST